MRYNRQGAQLLATYLHINYANNMSPAAAGVTLKRFIIKGVLKDLMDKVFSKVSCRANILLHTLLYGLVFLNIEIIEVSASQNTSPSASQAPLKTQENISIQKTPLPQEPPLPPKLPDFKYDTLLDIRKEKETFLKAYNKDSPYVAYSVDDQKVQKQAIITLPIANSSRAALFEYNGFYYLALDQKVTLNPSLFPRSLFQEVTPLDSDHFFAMRIKMRQNQDLKIFNQGNRWVLLAGELADETPNQLLKFTTQANTTGTTLTFKFEEPVLTFYLVDPTLNQGFQVVLHSNAGLQATQSFEPFKLIPTELGLAFKTRAKSISFSMPDSKTLMVAAPISSPFCSVSRDYELKPLKLPEYEGLNLNKFDYPSDDLVPLRRVYMAQIIKAPSKEAMIMPELELTKLYVSLGFPQEAHGLLKLIDERKPGTIESSRDLILLRDLILALANKFDTDQLLAPRYNLENTPEMQVVYGILQMRFGTYNVAYENFMKAASFIQKLPQELRNHIALLAFEAAVEVGDKKDFFLNLIDQRRLSIRELDYLKYLQARLMENKDPQKLMDKVYRTLLGSPNNRVATMSAIMLTRSNLLSLKDKIHVLDSARFLWRGDFVEFRLLADLAKLYRYANNPSKALYAYRTINSYLSDLERNQDVITVGQNLFYDYFVTKKDMDDFTKIGFYTAYFELAPRDSRFPEVIATLANSYLSLGLPEGAIDALKRKLRYLKTLEEESVTTPQSTKYLENVTRLQIARIQIGNSYFKEALETLKKIAPTSDHPETQSETNLLNALAHKALKQYSDALNDLSTLQPPLASRLRSDIYMTQENWPLALENLNQLLTPLSDKASIESAADIDVLIDTVIVAGHTQNTNLISQIRDTFVPKVTNKEQQELLYILTGKNQKPSLSKRILEDRIHEINALDKALTTLKKDLMP